MVGCFRFLCLRSALEPVSLAISFSSFSRDDSVHNLSRSYVTFPAERKKPLFTDPAPDKTKIKRVALEREGATFLSSESKNNTPNMNATEPNRNEERTKNVNIINKIGNEIGCGDLPRYQFISITFQDEIVFFGLARFIF